LIAVESIQAIGNSSAAATATAHAAGNQRIGRSSVTLAAITAAPSSELQ
jgi:hypothetical protein